MVVFGSRFKQLLGQEFGQNEIYNHNLEYFVERYPLRYRLFKVALKLECPEGIILNDAFEKAVGDKLDIVVTSKNNINT
jgi:hypothetical protein